jgi:hypothetical protein
MKTYILSIALIVLISASTQGKPINDIYSVREPALTDEPYVNDIPFSTALTAAGEMFDGYEARLKDEPAVNDIPFNTREIACKYLFCKMMASFSEPEAQDIPFDTRAIFRDCMMDRMTRNYRNEPSQKDNTRVFSLKDDEITIIYSSGAQFPGVEIRYECPSGEVHASPIFSL